MRPFLFALMTSLSISIWAQSLEVIYMAQAGYDPEDVEFRSRQFTQLNGVNVHITYEEYDAMYDILTSGRAEFDVLLLDTIWTADFADRGIIDPLPDQMEYLVRSNIIPDIYQANAYDGQLWAFPFLANFQLLYTNMDLLRRSGFENPPATLEELFFMAQRAKELGVIEYPVFESLRPEEILMCELVWLSGIDGSQWLDDAGNLEVDRPELRAAVQYLLALKRSGLLNPYSLDSGEMFSAEVFAWGDALFTSNWTFLIGELEELGENSPNRHFEVQVSPLPKADRALQSSTISGFQGLAVSSFSQDKDLAWQYIRFLSSPDFQRQHLDEFPVWESLWDDEDIQKAPYFAVKRAQVRGIRSRLVHPMYGEISRIIRSWVSRILREDVSLDRGFEGMQAELDNLQL